MGIIIYDVGKSMPFFYKPAFIKSPKGKPEAQEVPKKSYTNSAQSISKWANIA